MDSNQFFCSCGRLYRVTPGNAMMSGNTIISPDACPQCWLLAGKPVDEASDLFGLLRQFLEFNYGTKTPGPVSAADSRPWLGPVRFDEGTLWRWDPGARLNPTMLVDGHGYLFAVRERWRDPRIRIGRLDADSIPAQPDGMTNNAIVYCHAYNCTGPGIYLEYGEVANNRFRVCTFDVRGQALRIDASEGNVHDNLFENLELGAEMLVTGTCSNNIFDKVVVTRNPLRCGNASAGGPGDANALMYGAMAPGSLPIPGVAGYFPIPPLTDTSVPPTSSDPPNQYQDVYEAAPDGILRVWRFPNKGAT